MALQKVSPAPDGPVAKEPQAGGDNGADAGEGIFSLLFLLSLMGKNGGQDPVRNVLQGEDAGMRPGNLGETSMSCKLTEEHENVIPAQVGIQNAGSGLDSHLRGNDGQLAEDGRPVAHHEWRADDAQKSVAPAEPLSHPKPEADNAGLYGYHPDLSEETDTRSAGLYDRHSGAEADGVVQEEGNAQPSEGNPDSSAPSMASMGPAGECSSSAACMGTNVTASGVYPDIYKAGNSGKGNRGAGLKTFLEALRVEIERHKNYPPFARKNGIEGTAYLNFHIGDDGKPGGIALERSSGSKILDESAIRTLKGMERFYPVPEEIRELEITVPIAYRLMEDTEKVNR